jgi:hypothetical protein
LLWLAGWLSNFAEPKSKWTQTQTSLSRAVTAIDDGACVFDDVSAL